MPLRVRVAALGGVVGPVAFISAWVVSAAVTDHPYSPVEDAISRLAAAGADTQPLMTAGLVTLGLALPVYAVALRQVLPGPAWVAAATTGVATLAVAAAPLGRSPSLDTAHALFAAVGYAAIAATPLVAVRPLWRRGHRRLAVAGAAAGTMAAAALALSLSGLPTGLWQRLGLTSADAWIAASALSIACGRLGPGTPARASLTDHSG